MNEPALSRTMRAHKRPGATQTAPGALGRDLRGGRTREASQRFLGPYRLRVRSRPLPPTAWLADGDRPTALLPDPTPRRPRQAPLAFPRLPPQQRDPERDFRPDPRRLLPCATRADPGRCPERPQARHELAFARPRWPLDRQPNEAGDAENEPARPRSPRDAVSAQAQRSQSRGLFE